MRYQGINFKQFLVTSVDDNKWAYRISVAADSFLVELGVPGFKS